MKSFLLFFSEGIAGVEAVGRVGGALELILITSFIYFRRTQGILTSNHLHTIKSTVRQAASSSVGMTHILHMLWLNPWLLPQQYAQLVTLPQGPASSGPSPRYTAQTDSPASISCCTGKRPTV